jgi:hypothetical protein
MTPVGRLIDAEHVAREVISRVLDVPRDSFDVTVRTEWRGRAASAR